MELGLASRMVAQDSCPGSVSWTISPGPSLLASGCSELPLGLASSSPGLPPTEEVLSCLLPKDAPLGF